MGSREPYEIDRLRGIKNGKGIGRHPVQHQLALVDRAGRLLDQLSALDPRARKSPQLPDPETHPELHRELNALIGKQPDSMGRPRGSKILPSGQGPTELGQTEYNKQHRKQEAMRGWEEVDKPYRLQNIKDHYENSGAPIDDEVAEELYRQEREQGIPAMRGRLPVEETADRWPVMDPIQGEGERLAATKKPAKPRAPEEVWYDVHKHPEGVPGGMGKSPEYHLKNRGWQGHEINEGSGKKTIQYRNQKHPDFVVSYGGGTGIKPDHNFRVLYMGTNTNIPKVTRAYSVAEAMNKVEELHQLNTGLVVQPMTHGAATQTPPSQQPSVPGTPKPPSKPRDMTDADSYPQFPAQPEHERTWWNPQHQQLKEIPDPPSIKPPKYGLSKAVSALQRAQQPTWEDGA